MLSIHFSETRFCFVTAGRIQISEESKMLLDATDLYNVEYNGVVEIKVSVKKFIILFTTYLLRLGKWTLYYLLADWIIGE